MGICTLLGGNTGVYKNSIVGYFYAMEAAFLYVYFCLPLNIYFQTLTLALIAEDESLLKREIVEDMMSRIAQQAVERIDRTRKVAGTAFSALLHR